MCFDHIHLCIHIFIWAPVKNDSAGALSPLAPCTALSPLVVATAAAQTSEPPLLP